MFSLNTQIKIPDNDNIIFSNNESRPSKTLIDKSIFNIFQKLNVKELIIYDIIDIEDYNKKQYFLIELSKKLKIDNIINFEYDYNSICINETIIKNELFNFIFSFETNLNQKNLVSNIINIFNELTDNENYYIIINIDNVYNYTNLELIILFSQYSDKFYIYYSKILKQDIVILKKTKYNYSNKIFILNVFKYIFKMQHKSFLKSIGFYISPDILRYIKIYNNSYMQYYIDYNKKLSNLNMLENINSKYYKHKILNTSILNCKSQDCQHVFDNFSLEDCFICNKCFELFSFL